MLFFCGFSEYGLQFIPNTTKAIVDEKVADQEVVFEPRQIRCAVDAEEGDSCIDAARAAASWSTLIIAGINRGETIHRKQQLFTCPLRFTDNHLFSNAFII